MINEFKPVIDPEIFALRPDYCALSVVAADVPNGLEHPIAARLMQESRVTAAPVWAEAHLEAWRAAYRAFGAKPQRTLPSVEALLKRRDKDGTLPKVNAVVDVYNALSLLYAVPIGGENREAYVGVPRLTRASGEETFDSMKDGVVQAELVTPGEVIWRDELGVTCRRWNWRQCVRTRIEATTTSMWFLLERLEPMPMSALVDAGGLLVQTLLDLSPAASVESILIDSPLQPADRRP